MALVGSNAGGRSVADPSVNPSQLVSDANHGYQLHLLEQLHAARIMRGRSVEEVARLLDTEATLVEDIESGDYEPNLTELRQYAWAIEAVIDYRVHACAAAPLGIYRTELMNSARFDDVWAPGGAIPWSEDTDADSVSAVVKMVEGGNEQP